MRVQEPTPPILVPELVPEAEPPAQDRVLRLTFYFGLVYFCQGVSQYVCLIYQPLMYYLNKGHGFTPEQSAQFKLIAQMPWVIKPAYGLLSDFVPLLGYRRKTYLLLLNGLAALAFCWVAGATSPGMVLAALTLTGIGVAASDVIVDALMVEVGNRTGAVRRFQGVQWLCINVAAILSGLTGAWIIQGRSPSEALRLAALVCAVPPLAVLGMTWWSVRERRSRMDLPQLKETGRGLLSAVRSGSFWAVLGFLVLLSLNPGLQTPMYYHLVNTVKIQEKFLALTDAIAAAGMATGALLFLLVLSKHLSTRMLLVTGILSNAAGAVPFLFVRDNFTVGLANATWGVGYMIGNLAMLSLAAQTCPKRAEGFVFAAMMSIINLAMQYSDVVGANLYGGVLNKWITPLVLASIGLTLLGLVIVPFVPLKASGEGDAGANEDGR